MHAGVRVVCLDHVAEHERGAAVGAAELDHVVDACAPLLREHGHQRHEREHEQDDPRPADRGERHREAGPGQREVDAVDPAALAQLLRKRGSAVQVLAKGRGPARSTMNWAPSATRYTSQRLAARAAASAATSFQSQPSPRHESPKALKAQSSGRRPPPHQTLGSVSAIATQRGPAAGGARKSIRG